MNIQNLNEDMIILIAENGFTIEDYEKFKEIIKITFPNKMLSIISFEEDVIQR